MILDKAGLEKYLAQNPWPIEFSQAKQVEYIYSFHIMLTREKAWKYLSDTSGISRRLGLKKVTYTEKNGSLYGSSIHPRMK